jgi:hypothetical protein
MPPRPGAVWIPPTWRRGHGGYAFVPGRWRQLNNGIRLEMETLGSNGGFAHSVCSGPTRRDARASGYRQRRDGISPFVESPAGTSVALSFLNSNLRGPFARTDAIGVVNPAPEALGSILQCQLTRAHRSRAHQAPDHR